jgi:hypothetical protein
VLATRRTEVITRLQPEAKEKSGRRDSLISNYLKAEKSADDRALDLFHAKFSKASGGSRHPFWSRIVLKGTALKGALNPKFSQT